MRLKILIILLFAFVTIHAQKHEVRAVWLTTIGGIDWPRSHSVAAQKREMTDMLDKLKLVGINTVLVQTRVRASTIYPSSMEPFDMCLTGTHGRSPGYDPLEFIINECHKRGFECHAWIVTIPIGKITEARFKEFKRKNPTLTKQIGQEGFMNPENSMTGDYLARICSEVVRNYDVDGIHLDYIRYPETWPKAKNNEERKIRRNNITGIVRKINQSVKSLKPWVKISCSPIGKSGDLSRYRSGGWNAYQAVYQDAQGWLREGLMDQLYPMMYFRGNNFYPFALDWQERSYGRTIVSGLGIYFLSPREKDWPLTDISREMHFLRQNNIGHCYFRTKFLLDDTKGIYSFARDFDHAPALIPPMTWECKTKPEAPINIAIKRSSNNDRLKWDATKRPMGQPYILYNVYASTSPDVDINEPRNLIATRLMDTNITIPHTMGQTLYYAVTAIDRYGNESNATLSDRQAIQAHCVKPMTPRDTKIPPFYFFMSKKERKKLGL